MSRHFPYHDVVDPADARLEDMEAMTNGFDLQDKADKVALHHVVTDFKANGREFLLVEVTPTKVEVWAKPKC